MRTHRQMDATSAKKIVDTFSDAVKSVPLMGEDRNDNEYRRALALVEFLVDHDDLENPLFELLCARISEYEKHAPEFKALNQHLEKTPLAFQYCERSWINTVSKQQILPTNLVLNRTSATS